MAVVAVVHGIRMADGGRVLILAHGRTLVLALVHALALVTLLWALVVLGIC
jgi:hypothetical protein